MPRAAGAVARGVGRSVGRGVAEGAGGSDEDEAPSGTVSLNEEADDFIVEDSGKEFCPDCGQDLSKADQMCKPGLTHQTATGTLGGGPGISSVEYGGQVRTNIFAPGSAGSDLVSTFGSGVVDSNITGVGMTRESFAGGAA